MPNRYPRPVTATVTSSSSVPELLREFTRVLTMWTPHVYAHGALVAAYECGEGYRSGLGVLGRSVTRIGVQHDELADYVNGVATAFEQADAEARTGAAPNARSGDVGGGQGDAKAGDPKAAAEAAAEAAGGDGTEDTAKDEAKAAAGDGAEDTAKDAAKDAAKDSAKGDKNDRPDPKGNDNGSNSVEGVLKKARSQKGYREKGTNLTKFGSWYGANGQAWCAMFVSWSFHKAGMPLPKVQGGTSGFAKVREGYLYAKRHDRLVWVPKPGDVFLHRTKNTLGHTGIVTRVDLKKGIVYTIEGNTNRKGSREGDGVMEKSHPLSYFNQGFWRPTGAIAAGDRVRPKWGYASWPSGANSPARKKKRRTKKSV